MTASPPADAERVGQESLREHGQRTSLPDEGTCAPIPIARTGGRGPGRVFSALRSRNYRLFFYGQLISVTGTWMQRVAQDWLILELGGGPFELAIGLSLQSFPVLLFGIWGGLLVDRTADRRRLMAISQGAQGATAIVLGALVISGDATLLAVFAAALFTGFVTVLDGPVSQTFVVSLVGTDRLANAMALNASTNNAARLVGPALAGITIGLVGTGATFLLNALTFGAILAALSLMDNQLLMHAHVPVARLPGQAMDGLKYTLRDVPLRTTVLATVLVSLFSQNFRITLPLLAADVFGGGATDYGALMSALGAGALCGALVCAYVQAPSLRIVSAAATVLGVLLLAVAVAPGYTEVLCLLVGVGVGSTAFNTTSKSWVVLAAGPAMRGRVVSVRAVLATGLTPIGSLSVGMVCELFGARAGMGAGGMAALLAGWYVWRCNRQSLSRAKRTSS